MSAYDCDDPWEFFMTAKDAISNLRELHAHEPVEFFLYLASHSHELRLTNGAQLADLTDVKAFLVEMAEAALLVTPKRAASVPPQKRWHATCPRCGHVHEGAGECGVFMGSSAGFCRCELEVPA